MTATLTTACLFMLGRYTPFYGLVFRFVPGIDLFRRPTDASFVFGIALAMLAGHCLSDYVREGLPRIRPIAAILTGSVWLAIMVSAIVFSARTGHALEAGLQSLVTGMVMLAAAVLILFCARRPGLACWPARLSHCCRCRVVVVERGVRLNAQSRSDYAVLETPAGAEANAIAVLETNIAADHRSGDWPRVEVLGLGGAMAKSRNGPRVGGHQWIQPAPHRLVRSHGLARRRKLGYLAAAISTVL